MNRHTDMLVAEAAELPSIESAVIGGKSDETPMRRLAFVIDGVPVQLAWHAASTTGKATAARGGV